MMSVSRRQDAVLSEGTPPPPPLRRPLLCVSILTSLSSPFFLSRAPVFHSSSRPVSSVSQESSRCCLGGKDSCTLLSSCALDQSVLAVPNIKHKIPL